VIRILFIQLLTEEMWSFMELVMLEAEKECDTNYHIIIVKNSTDGGMG